jgi:integrase
MKINWKEDYQREFICPKCNQGILKLSGFDKDRKNFVCINCKRHTLASIDINLRSRYLESRLKDEHIDWKKNYSGEFACPQCQTLGMRVRKAQIDRNKKIFYCPNCRHLCPEFCKNIIKAVEDPLNPAIIWYTNYWYQEFICSNCQAQNIYYCYTSKGKKNFLCRTCKKTELDCIDLTTVNLRRFSEAEMAVIPFYFNKDIWDLRAINHNFDSQDISRCIVRFSRIKVDWFKKEVKKYIQYLCQANKSNSFKTIQGHLCTLRAFACYLNQNNIKGFSEITRSLIINYLAQEKNINKSKLGTLRFFFETGIIRGWFIVERDLVRDEDYPKQRRGNPDPISDIVYKQIEQNLYKLPDPIARMWIICFFAAMRPSELALLKKDCLVQEGQHWKLVWQRKKGKDYHEVPISRTIAKVVQEQQEYISSLWGKEWEYLFCHYQNLSQTDSSQPNLKPVRKVITEASNNPLRIAICCLIKTEKILNENGKSAKFTSKILRHTRLTQLFEQGHDLAVVSAWAGHKNFATTSTYYTQVSCELMEREAGHIQRALVNSDGHSLAYESLPKSFWEKPQAHKLELEGTHINTPIYGYCGLPLDEDCEKFRACYTCPCFVAVPEKLSQYIKVRDELRAKESKALANGQDVLVEQFGRQADQLDKIIEGLQRAA